MENEKLAQRVKELRKIKGLSQEELSKNSGLSLRTIQRVENGETEPTGETLKRISAVLDVTPNELINWDTNNETPKNLKLVEILLIEDNPGDARLTKEALKDGKVKNILHIVYDGVEATDFLFKRNQYQNAPRPDLIILDLNLPKKNGQEVLAEIKADDNLKSIPVIILTISKAEEDILRSYNLHANCFLIKPIDLNKFFEVVKSIEDFWLTLVKLPKL